MGPIHDGEASAVLRMRMIENSAAGATRPTLSTLPMLLGAAAFAAAAAAVVPASAKKADTTADQNQPMTIVVSLRNQKAEIYRGTTLITSTRVSTGKRGHSTKPGVFSILEKRRRHYSNLYNGAPMPWMQRLTWSGTAFHAGVVPGYPASHGCIRLPYSFAPKLFSMTNVGEQVVIARGRVEPKLIQHSTLFQPLPLPMPPTLVKQGSPEPKIMRRSSNNAAPASKTRLPVVFAKAESGQLKPSSSVGTDGPAPVLVNATLEMKGRSPVAAAMLEDTRKHAIDPYAAPVVARRSHALAAERAAGRTEQRAAVGARSDLKHRDRLAGVTDAPEASESTVASLPESTAEPVKLATPEGDPIIAAEADVGEEPRSGGIFTVAAAALETPVPQPVAVSIALTMPGGHPPLPPVKPSIMVAKLIAGTTAAAVEAAEPRSPEPLRILVTRRTKRDRLIDVQYILSSMGYLEPQNFDGTFGRLTANAIKSFQKANDMPETGAFTDELAKKIYEMAGQDEPPQGHLFVRQKFASVFDTPVSFRNPDKPLGTHVFTVMHFEPDAPAAEWMVISLNDEQDAATVLDRIEIPEDVRQQISERLTPGSSLIVADTAINSATLPKGADFLVWDATKSATVERASVSPKPRRKKRRATSHRRTMSPAYTRPYQPRRNSWFPF
jgi:peptidoglycan hydrolase-like protein with peptidoglycan-binding domain